jgi:hypothetical protein
MTTMADTFRPRPLAEHGCDPLENAKPELPLRARRRKSLPTYIPAPSLDAVRSPVRFPI